MTSSAPLAVSLGDPAGIGPELIAEAWARRGEADVLPFFVVGGSRLIAAAGARRGLALEIRRIDHPSEAAETFPSALPVITALDCEYSPGIPSHEGAALALASLEQATGLVRAGAASGLVTAPVSKSALAQCGFAYPGQTEYLAAACGKRAEDAVMMLAGPNLRTVPVTVHCALADVPGQLSVELIRHKAKIAACALARDFGIDAPRIAISALNPHAGEGGAFGNEEREIIAPAIAELREEGIDATGPHPGDALFTPRARDTYDVALAMYHDQALIPLKALDFDDGVNVTLGLPMVRTSPDHGTAFGIAGTGEADPRAFIAALRLAARIADRRA